ncbi:hypothetical protein ACFSO9_00810 [Mesonia maritima]|uniref:hypothetical protein n=1 Tax=Mesonia maritima TaxID=1793873 RepID=UPI003635CABD
MKRNHNKTYLAFSCLFMFLLNPTLIFAQNSVEKVTESYDVNDDVEISLDTRQTEVIVETWNRNTVEIQASVSAEDVSEEELNEIADAWQLAIMGNSNKISIQSKVQPQGFSNLSHAISSTSSEFIEPLMNMVGPMLETMSSAAYQLPPEFYSGISNLNFDYDAYKRDGEAYVEEYEKKIEKHFGKDFENAMEEWGERFEKNAEAWEKQIEARMKAMEESGELEKRQEAFAKRMEAWGKRMEQMANRFEENDGQVTRTVTTSPNGSKSVRVHYVKSGSFNSAGKVNRTITIKMPKQSKLKFNLRHGSLTLEDRVENLSANLSYAALNAEEIAGKKTSLNVAYAPVNVNNWEYGALNLSYVKECKLNSIKSIKLNSNASDVIIENIDETGIISGIFGELSIAALGKDFKRLDINLENSDLLLKLPETSFNFSYSGSRSNVNFPKKLSTNVLDNYDSKLINGYYKSRNTNSSININAKFSEVLMK